MRGAIHLYGTLHKDFCSQLRATLALYSGFIVRGSAATLLAACSLAATGQRVLIATANDYLASRDADWMAKVYTSVNLSVSSITASTPQQARSAIYTHDVVYGTLREFAFDFLRHALESRKKNHSDIAELEFPKDILIIDEADSILIDEARTPMIITAPITKIDQAKESCYRWASNAAIGFQRPRDYVRIDGSGRRVRCET